MSMIHRLELCALAALTFSASVLLTRASAYAADDLPLARAHAHNDYEHARPLRDALEAGFSSVEADVWLVNGQLLVAHDLEDVSPQRTLESLYLEPLRQQVQGAFATAERLHGLQLLIDVKSEAEPTYRALDDVLARYRDILTVFTDGGVSEGAVTAVISGNRARELMTRQRVRFAGYDGRSSDLAAGAPSALIPLISDNWTTLFSWRGEGPMPQEQRDKLTAFVRAAHEDGQRVRFWATPDQSPVREAVWRELIAAGVDYVNTDDLAGLASFLRASDPHPHQPEVDWFTAAGAERACTSGQSRHEPTAAEHASLGAHER
jgi:hypothetical protein